METFVDLVKNALWPIVVLWLGLRYRDEFRGLLERVTIAKLPGAEFGFGRIEKLEESTAAPKHGRMQESLVVPDSPADNNRDARCWSYYWLGHDLMWTEDCLYRGATKEYIVHGLATSLDHLRAIGLGDASFESKLVSLQGRVSAMLEIDLTAEMRRLLGIDIAALKVRLGECIQTENSPGCQTDGPGDRVPQKQ